MPPTGDEHAKPKAYAFNSKHKKEGKKYKTDVN